MAKVKKYGKTWWGNAWVEALERIDQDTNRLPRGRSYARGDKVSRIVVAGDVAAKVQGRRRTPYKVEIRLKKFSPKEIEAERHENSKSLDMVVIEAMHQGIN